MLCGGWEPPTGYRGRSGGEGHEIIFEVCTKCALIAPNNAEFFFHNLVHISTIVWNPLSIFGICLSSVNGLSGFRRARSDNLGPTFIMVSSLLKQLISRSSVKRPEPKVQGKSGWGFPQTLLSWIPLVLLHCGWLPFQAFELLLFFSSARGKAVSPVLCVQF